MVLCSEAVLSNLTLPWEIRRVELGVIMANLKKLVSKIDWTILISHKEASIDDYILKRYDYFK